MQPCRQCPPSWRPQRARMLRRPAGASAPRCCLHTLQHVPRNDTAGPWGDPSMYPASLRSIVPSWLRWLDCLRCPSPLCTHARIRLVPQKAFCVARLSRCVCAGVTAQSPPSPAAPSALSPVGRAGSPGAVGGRQLSSGHCGGLGALGQQRCGVSIAMFLLRLSWRLVAVEGACPRCTNTG